MNTAAAATKLTATRRTVLAYIADENRDERNLPVRGTTYTAAFHALLDAGLVTYDGKVTEAGRAAL